MVLSLFRRAANRHLIDRLHGDIVAATRQPAFYRDLGVADTFDGRFEILALLSTLVVRRLARLPSPGPDIAQDLTDAVFRHLDPALREMGVGDLTVPKRMRKLAAALLGRRQAYEGALGESGDDVLVAALARNVYGDDGEASLPQARGLAHYVRRADAALARAPLEAFVDGPTPFPEVDEAV
jgi:cytochrome b pre-mRNA-processing protein 3